LTEVRQPSHEELIFVTSDGQTYKMYHEQDCCEGVSIEDICGDLQDLVGEPITEASEETSQTNPEGVKVSQYQESFTWTFYKLGTRKGSVTLRWYGESNGYYSESVDFRKVA
jgi:hypothetical protein